MEAIPIKQNDNLSDISVPGAKIKRIIGNGSSEQILLIFRNSQAAQDALVNSKSDGRYRLQRINAVIKDMQELPTLNQQKSIS